jgi:hypothetical protein
VPGHGIVAREEVLTGHGVCVRLHEWDPEFRTLGRELGSTFDGENILPQQMNRISGLSWKYEPPGVEREVIAFSEQWPCLAEALELSRFLPKPCFDLGHCIVQKAIERGPLAAPILWHELIRRHQEGDFGRYGKLEADHEFTEAEMFTMPLLPVHLQNLRAIQTQTRCVRSEYAVPGRSGLAYVLTVFMTSRVEGIRTVAWINPV